MCVEFVKRDMQSGLNTVLLTRSHRAQAPMNVSMHACLQPTILSAAHVVNTMLGSF